MNLEQVVEGVPQNVRAWLTAVWPQVEANLSAEAHGKMGDWQAAVSSLPRLEPSSYDLLNKVRIGTGEEVAAEVQQQIEQNLRQLHPWRKGPFEIFGVEIDTEWRSDWKWDRLKEHIEPLDGRLVLDVGCGNGYHCWRMLGAGARQVIGLDPFLVYVMQFAAVKRYLPEAAVGVLPLGIEALATDLGAFGTVFSMGVLYHRRSPFDHLLELRDSLQAGGELVLETLVVEGEAGQTLVPEGRYAKMRNVWFIPSCLTLESWLKKVWL